MTRHLHVIHNTATGEIAPTCEDCIRRDVEIEGLQAVIRSQGAKIRKLERDEEAAAYGHELWPKCETLFEYWKAQTGHKRCPFTPDRFWLMLPFVKRYGEDMVRRAIRGIAFDPYEKVNKRGKVERYDGLETLFRSAGSFERYANRAVR